MEESIQALEKEVLKRKPTEAELREQLSDLKAQNASLVKQTAEFAHVREELEEKRDELELFRTDLERAMDALVESQKALKKAKEAADAANRSKGEFLAKMSHEIRMPMNGVLGMAELLSKTELNDRQRRFLQVVQSSGASLVNIINEILDFSKIEAGKLKLECIDLDVVKVVEDAVECLAALAHSKGLALTSFVDHDVPTRLSGDPGRLRQVLTNLTGNAIKFTKKGEVAVRVSKVEEAQDRALLRFEVKDTGIGIAPEAQSQIFEDFMQADGSTTRKYGGTGLGLNIARQLTEMMGGEIGVDSTPSQGSTFWFTVPFQKDPATVIRGGDQDTSSELASSQMPAEVQQRFDGHVLVAEDTLVNQEVAVGMLESVGCRVDVVENGREAVKAVSTMSYDLIFMDCQMPDMDGYEATRIIRRKEEEAFKAQSSKEEGASPTGSSKPTSTIQYGASRKRIPIIALTAHAMEGDREQCLTAGMDDYLSKPFDVSKLSAILERWLPAARVVHKTLAGSHDHGLALPDSPRVKAAS
jgi:signal transduction histidine kinase/DNA-binding NarL/FixJ family response regulator